MVIHATKKASAHWQSNSICGKRTWKRDHNSRHLPQAASSSSSFYGASSSAAAAPAAASSRPPLDVFSALALASAPEAAGEYIYLYFCKDIH